MDRRIKVPRMTSAIALVMLILVAPTAFVASTAVKTEVENADYIIQTTVTFSNNGTTTWNLTKEEREISLFMNNTWQTVYLTNSSSPTEKTEDADGNPTATLQLPKLKLDPGENATYTVTYSIESNERSIPQLSRQESWNLTQIPPYLKEEHCNRSDTWQTTDSTLLETAHAIAGNETKVLSIVEGLIEWMWDPEHMSYGSYEVPRYPNETISGGKGDCDDQAMLLITFCRILGIPSYLQVGCIYDPGSTPLYESSWNGTLTSVLKHIAWHGWATVYVPPWGWLPVDLTYATGGKSNPLNAITTAAVRLQKTIQYMNISQRDYVASSRKYRDFLIENQFYIYQDDEMRTAFQISWEEVIERLLLWMQSLRWFPIAMGVILGAFIAVFGYILTVERRRDKELKKSDEKANISYNPQ